MLEDSTLVNDSNSKAADAKYTKENSLKLLISNLPLLLSEQDIKEMFEKEFGTVNNVKIVYNKTTGVSKGACLLSFESKNSALNVFKMWNDSKILPTMDIPLKIKMFDSENNRNDRKLFVGMLLHNTTEEDLRRIFDPYGSIEECKILKNPLGKSRGCAFITYCDRESALKALRSIKETDLSSRMNVKFADTYDTKKERIRAKLANHFKLNNNLNSFPNSIPLVQPNDFMFYSGDMNNRNAMSLFSIPSTNYDLINLESPKLFSNSNSRKSSYGDKSLYNGSISDYIASEKLFENLDYQPQDFNPSSNLFNQQGILEWRNNINPFVEKKAHSVIDSLNVMTNKQIIGPKNSNLFIYQLPADFTDSHLIMYFKEFGRILSAKVFIDKQTNLSKCFGFVSFDNPKSAGDAIRCMNGASICNKTIKVQLKKSIK